jgi:hypothetical protein
MVLDGAVDPVVDDLANSEDQARGFEDAFDRYAADCLRGDCPLRPDPRAFLARLLARAEAAPIPSSSKRDDRADAGTIRDTVANAMYGRFFWPQLTQALVDADHGDARRAFELLGSSTKRTLDDNAPDYFLAANLAIHCADLERRVTTAQVRAKTVELGEKYPIFGTGQALGMLYCGQWKAPTRPVVTVHAPTAAATILVVGTHHDPATPYVWAQRLRAALGHATLLGWDGDGHTAYPQTNCVIDAVNAYLIAGTVPAPDTTCPTG